MTINTIKIKDTSKCSGLGLGLTRKQLKLLNNNKKNHLHKKYNFV